jgi:hypothetical protein
VEVQHVDALLVHDALERRPRPRIELRLLEVGDVDTERVERLLRKVALAQAHERDREARRVEARDHPGEQPLDAVHARAFPAQVVADVEDVQRAIVVGRNRHVVEVGTRSTAAILVPFQRVPPTAAPAESDRIRRGDVEAVETAA